MPTPIQPPIFGNSGNTIPTCKPTNPIATYETGGAPSVLNYNIPYTSEYNAVAFVELPIPTNKIIRKPNPVDTFWSKYKNKPINDILAVVSKDIGFIHNYERVTRSYVVDKNNRVSSNAFDYNELQSSMATAPSGTDPYSVVSGKSIDSKINLRLLAENAKVGLKPIAYERLNKTPDIIFVPEPPPNKDAKIVIVLHLKIATFLGDYGAGETVKTFSLLPGEKTTISIRNYVHSETSKKQAESILDSYSSEAADDIQHDVEQEMQFTSGLNKSETYSETGSWNAGGSAGLNLGFFSVGASGGASGTSTTGSSVATALQTQAKGLNKAMSHHVAKANSNRKVEVNTETNEKNIVETEETITRVLENPNKSRVLNFVFRQLLQEYITLTYVDDVSFIYWDGHTENRRTASLFQLIPFLEENCGAQAEVVKQAIVVELASLIDYQGNVRDNTPGNEPFVECVIVKPVDCQGIPTPGNVNYVRKRRNFQMTYQGKTVPGLIVDVQKRTLRTPSVIVEALLGQGEALDCYNMALQQAAVVSAYQQNESQQFANEFTAISTPTRHNKLVLENTLLDKLSSEIGNLPAEQKVEVLKTLAKKCCDTPQCTCGCNDNTSTQ
ncbi:MAG: hypothetical protein JNJ85_09585 [Candidatus Kapabacteria bacterium]|nr:hypothetical protein [Candidatus Kapabacteria bacterium]